MGDIALSAVVQLIDGFDHRPLVGIPPRFLVDGRPMPAMDKSQGFHAFTRLDRGEHKLDVMVAGFFPATVPMIVPPAQPLAEGIIVCPLAPAPSYAYPPWAAVLRGRVTSALPEARPLPGIAVTATYRGRDGSGRSMSTVTAAIGAYDGRYALALPGRRSGAIAVAVTFGGPGFADHGDSLTLEAGRTVFLDVALTRSPA